MTRFVISSNSSLISLSCYTRLRGGQVRNALRDVHPVPDSRAIGMRTARPKDEQCESNAPKAPVVHQSDQRLTHTLARMRRTPKGDSRKVMHYTNHQSTPVFSSDGQPLMPTHPAKARKLLQKGRAVPHHVKGLFGIRLLDRTRDESSVQDVAVNIDPGSQTTGIAVVADNEDGQRTVLAALEIKHRAFTIKATLTKRRNFRRNRRARLRFRAPRFDNRRRKPGTLPPSVDSLRIDTMRVVGILRRMYPITHIRLEHNKFDPPNYDEPRRESLGVPTRHPVPLAGTRLHPRKRPRPLHILPASRRTARTRPRAASRHRLRPSRKPCRLLPRLQRTEGKPAHRTVLSRPARVTATHPHTSQQLSLGRSRPNQCRAASTH